MLALLNLPLLSQGLQFSMGFFAGDAEFSLVAAVTTPISFFSITHPGGLDWQNNIDAAMHNISRALAGLS